MNGSDSQPGQPAQPSAQPPSGLSAQPPSGLAGQPPSGPAGQPPPHEAIAPISFLLGRWEGAGVVGYPTMESINFGEEITFSHNGKPYLIYSSRTWLLEQDGTIGRVSHMELGFWRPQPDNQIEVLITHPTGVSEIYLGEISGTRIELITDAVLRTSTAKEVTAGKRLYGMIGADLGYAFDMAAVGQGLQPHLSAQLKRVSSDPS